MKTFSESLVITRNILVIVVLVLLVIWFFGGFDKTEKPASPVVQSTQQCPEHTFCDGHHQTELYAVEVKKTVMVLEEKVFPPPPPCGVQNINIDNLTVQTQIINNDTTEVHKLKLRPREREVVEEPIQQDALIQYEDRSSGYYETHYYSGGGYYSVGTHLNTGNGGGGWNSRNAPVRTPNCPGRGLDTRCR